MNGDVVLDTFCKRKYVVKYNIKRAGYFLFDCGDGCGYCEYDTVRINNAEVIGNIYDNPELLRGENEKI